MAAPLANPLYRPFQPDPASLCLCGSGLRFKHCCKGRLPGAKQGEGWKRAALDKRWSEVIKLLRADITQYTIWHLSHTAPAVARRPGLKAGHLFQIDIMALAEQVELLIWAYFRRGRQDKLGPVLDRLTRNIDDEAWRAKITFLKALTALRAGDRSAARLKLAPLQPITTASDDIELLQLHVDLHASGMGQMERLSFFSRIAELSTTVSDKLQYAGAKAFEVLLLGDDKGARTEFEKAVALGRELEAAEDDSFGAVAEIWFCRVLEGRAVLDSLEPLYEEIDKRLSRMLEGYELSREGRADVLRMLGDARRYAGRYAGAIDAYRQSIALGGPSELLTFEAECELRLGKIDEAFRLIRSVQVNKLDDPERADHAFTYFYIALARGERESLNFARDLLKQAVTPHAYFQTRRLQHIATVGEALEAIEKNQQIPALNPILGTLKKVSRYAQLQPNWLGLGVNGNAIIDDVVAKAEEKQRQRALDSPKYPGLPSSKPAQDQP